MMLSLAAKIGTGVSVLDTAGIDCQGLNALAALYDGYEKVGHDGSIDADEGMSAALARHQTSLDEQAAELQLNESQRYLEEAQEEGSAVQAQVGQGYQKLLQLLAAHPEEWNPDAGRCQGLERIAVKNEMYWVCSKCAEAARTSPAGSISSATVQAQTRPADTPPIPVANTSAPVVVTPASEPPVTSTCACAIL